MVAAKLRTITKGTCVRFWHHSILWLYKYLAFERI